MTDAEQRIVKDATAELADAADETLGVRADDLRAEILAALDRLVAERDALLPPYSAATQLFIDAICHYRNLSISLGAKPKDMINDYDRRLAESGVEDGDGEGWWNEAPSLWDDLEAAEAERDRLREAATAVVHQYHLWSEDASDGTYALWEKDGLINAIIALRDAMGGHQ